MEGIVKACFEPSLVELVPTVRGGGLTIFHNQICISLFLSRRKCIKAYIKLGCFPGDSGEDQQRSTQLPPRSNQSLDQSVV